jgi:hypothetical protein
VSRSLPRDPTAFAAAAPPPISDDDTYTVIDEALSDLAARRGLNLGDPHMTNHLIASLIEQAERFLPQEVLDATADGTTWATIAALLGTSPDQAALRYHPDSPIADHRWPYNY